MKRVNSEELAELITDYANVHGSKPLFVFGERYGDGRREILERVLGESYFEIKNEFDAPKITVPFCLYDSYNGKRCNLTLYRCIEIAAKIHRPMFCFIDNSLRFFVPEEILNGFELYHFKP